jgi:hypothetical protein
MKIEYFYEEFVPKICSLSKVDQPLQDIPEPDDSQFIFKIGMEDMGAFEIAGQGDMLAKLPEIMKKLFKDREDVFLILSSPFDMSYLLIDILYSIGLNISRVDSLSGARLRVGELVVEVYDKELSELMELMGSTLLSDLVSYFDNLAFTGHELFGKVADILRECVPSFIPFANCTLLLVDENGDGRVFDSMINYDTGNYGQGAYHKINKISERFFGTSPLGVEENEKSLTEKFEKLEYAFEFMEGILSEKGRESASKLLKEYRFMIE